MSARPPRHRVVIAAAAVVVAASLSLVPAATAKGGGHHGVVLVDTLQAPRWRTFDDRDAYAWWPLGRPQAMGPRFVVRRPVLLTEVGAFLNASPDNRGTSSAPPYSVEVRRAGEDGRPALGPPLAVRAVSDDRDDRVWRYERARFALRLRPGTYFALVTARAPATFDTTRPAGVLGAWGLDPQGEYLYLPGRTTVGFVDHVARTSEVYPVHDGPFRVVVQGLRRR